MPHNKTAHKAMPDAPSILLLVIVTILLFLHIVFAAERCERLQRRRVATAGFVDGAQSSSVLRRTA
jgi:hypothetical protein